MPACRRLSRQQARAAYAASQATNPTPELPASQFNVRGGLTFPGVNGEPEGLYDTPMTNIMPRLGFAYKLNDKTVVRGGYGLYYGFLGQRRGDVFQIGYSASTPMTVSTNNGLSFIETLSNPFQGGILEPRGSADGIATFLGQGISYFDPNPKSPKNQRWQVGLQRDLGGVWVTELRYVGNYGSELETGAQHQRAAQRVPEHEPDPRSGAQRLSDRAGAESIRRPDALVGARRLPRRDHRAAAAAPAVSALRRHQHHDQ